MSEPSIKVKSSSSQRKSSVKWPLWGLIMLLAGGAAWCGGTEQGARFAEQSKAKIMALLGKQDAATADRTPAQEGDAAGRIRQESSPQMVAGAISSGSKPADPDAERDARIDKAVQDARRWSEEHAPAQPVSPIASGENSPKAAGSADVAAAQAGAPEAGKEASGEQEGPSEPHAIAESGGPAAIADGGGTAADADAAVRETSDQPGPEAGGTDSTGAAEAVTPVVADAADAAKEGPSGPAGNAEQAGSAASDAGLQASPPKYEGMESGSAHDPSAAGDGAKLPLGAVEKEDVRSADMDGAHAPSGVRGGSYARIAGPAAAGRIRGGGQPARGTAVHGKITKKAAPAETGRGAYLSDGSYGGRLESSTAPEADRDDPVVTGDYVADTARWLASCYVPSSRAGGQGSTTATLERLNERGGASSLLRSHERDPLKSRRSVLRHVFTPGMMQALGQMYAPRFLDEMERSASARREGALDRMQTADMFRVYARRFQQASVSLSAASESDVSRLSEAIRQHSAGESEANAAFARAYNAQSQARAAGDSSAVRTHSQRMAESSRLASQHAAAQDRARNELSTQIRTRAVGEPLPARELSFLGLWLARRNATPEATRAAADVCRYLSEKCSERADAIEDIAGAN